ncbi:hypothetical protein [Amycolatopsis sp. NPDC051128]|uniref:hypothetical protein n=1 Tax=Amycolatopsis sp. NPDC051128 TaxID=3155412 RepID=UPI0034239564
MTSLPAATTPAAAAAADLTGGGSPLAWTQCPGAESPADLQCAELDVPVDWSRPHQRRITLDIARLPTTAAGRLGTVLLAPGGPGGSGIVVGTLLHRMGMTGEPMAGGDVAALIEMVLRHFR